MPAKHRSGALAVLVVLLLAATAHAHAPSDAHVRLAVDGDTITGRIDVAVRDLDAALGPGAGAVAIETYLAERFAIAGCAITFAPGALVALSEGTYRATPLAARCPGLTDTLAIDYRLLFDIDTHHRALVHVGSQTLIIREADTVIATLDAPPSVLAFVGEGVWHIWIGLDHVLFLVCLLLPAVFPRRGADSFRAAAREVLGIVTAFTLAHSITLVISAVGFVQLPSRIVETAIALSVVAAAANNLVRLVDARWAVAFALGLLHGFGFSSVLVDLGLPSRELVGSLLGFNLGVELGQLAIVVALLPLFYAMRRTFAYRVVLWAGSGVTVIVAAVWTYERMIGA